MEKYPEESDEKIGRRCQQEIRNDPALQRAIYEDIYRDLFQGTNRRQNALASIDIRN
jgi:hypothetical protein